MIFACPEATEAERVVHAKIDELRTNLSYAVSSRRWTGLLRRVALARAIRGSNAIEGFNVTVDDALAAVDGEASQLKKWLKRAVAGKQLRKLSRPVRYQTEHSMFD